MHTHHRSHFFFSHQLDKLKEGVYPLYIVHTIRGFVSSLIGFFVPIYFFKIGFSVLEILLFFAINYYFAMMFSLLAGGIGNKVGLKHTMIISLPLFLLYLISIIFLEEHPSRLFFYSLAIFNAFISTFYWIPLHSLFARLSSDKKESNQVGTFISLRSLASIIAPLLGGIISVVFGFHALFIISIIILIIPIIILLKTPDIRPHLNFSLSDLWAFTRQHLRLFLTIILDSFGKFSEEILWPLFVFLILRDTVAVGIVGSLVGVGIILFSLIIGRIVAHRNYWLVIKISAFMLASFWLLKAFASEKITIYLFSFFAAIFIAMFSIPLTSHTYSLAKRNKNLDEFIVFKQFLVYFGCLLAVLLAILLVDKLNLSFTLTSLNYFIISLF